MNFKNLPALQALVFSTLLITTSQAQQELAMVLCDDGTEYRLASGHGLSKEIEVAKQDGPIVYGIDEDDRVYSFEYDDKSDELKRTKIFRFPLLGTFYSTFVDNSNSFQLSKDKDGQPMPWAVSHIRYNENARTIGLLVMTQKNPVYIRNMDPWLPPWHTYEHTGPFGITGVNIATGGQTIAIIGFNVKGEHVIAYRQMTFDLSGSNPMMTYQYPGGYIKNPSWIMKKLGEKAGVPQEVTQLPTEDWVQIKLDVNHKPYARMYEDGRQIAIPKAAGGASVYDIINKKWIEDMPVFMWPANVEWPEYKMPLHDVPQTYRTTVDGVEGKVTESSREPELWKFKPLDGGKEQILYFYSPGFLDTLSNKKYVFNEEGKQVKLSRLLADE